MNRRPIDNNTLFVTADELASYLPISGRKISKLADRGVLPFYQDLDLTSGRPRKIYNLYEVKQLILATKQEGLTTSTNNFADREIAEINYDFTPRTAA